MCVVANSATGGTHANPADPHRIHDTRCPVDSHACKPLPPTLTNAPTPNTVHRKTRFQNCARYGANDTITRVARMITPSTSSGDNHDGQPGHAVIAARLRSELNDKTKLMVAINTVSHTDAVRLRITRRKVRSASSCASSRLREAGIGDRDSVWSSPLPVGCRGSIGLPTVLVSRSRSPGITAPLRRASTVVTSVYPPLRAVKLVNDQETLHRETYRPQSAYALLAAMQFGALRCAPRTVAQDNPRDIPCEHS